MVRKLLFSLLLGIILLVSITPIGKSSAYEVPQRGLRLVYDLTLPILEVNPLKSFHGTIEFTFLNVKAEAADLFVVIDGEIITDNQPTELHLNYTTSTPIGVNTLLYLAPTSDPQKQKNLEITTVPLLLDSIQIDLGGVYSYEGESTIKTPVGYFQTYQLKNQTSTMLLNIESHLYYDKDSRILIYSDMKVSSGLLSSVYTMELTELIFESDGIGSVDDSPCLIATAAYGSSLSREVHQLRTFRDTIVLDTYLGTIFMKGFNGVYYLFSPSIAEVEREQIVVRTLVRAALIPLLNILQCSEIIYNTLPFNPELAILLVGAITIAASILIYLFPLTLVLYYLTLKIPKEKRSREIS